MKLFSYQQDIINRCTDKGNALYMDVGTGKTPTSLGLFKKSKCKKLLIICLVSKINEWHNDVTQKFLNLDTIKLNKKSSKKNDDYLEENINIVDCIIVNFEMIWRLETLQKYINKDWYIIIDEAHKIKNPSTKIWKYLSKLKDKTPYKCILTATPQSKGYIDYWTGLNFVDILPMKLSAFKTRYCVYEHNRQFGRYFLELIGYKNTKELDNIIQSRCVFFRRDKTNDEIPTEIEIKIDSLKEYDKLRKNKIISINNTDIMCDTPLKLRLRLRQLCSGFCEDKPIKNSPKEQWLIDFLSGVNDRIVIFYNFNRELIKIKEICKTLKLPYSEYNGDKKDLKNFCEHTPSVAIVNYKSGSTGINELVKSNVCIMYSPPESYIDFEQAKGRIDRIGQTKKPLYYYLITRFSVEEDIYSNVKNGKNYDDKLFNAYMDKLK